MAVRARSWLSWPGLIRTLFSDVRLSVRLVRDPLVPMFVKVIPLAAAAYVLSPIDVAPDVIPLIGQLDDLGVVLVALELFLKWCPAPAVHFHRSAIDARRRYSPMPSGGGVIDAEWRTGS